MQDVSTKKLAALLDVEYADARGLIKVLEKHGLATQTGTVKAASGKGKGTTVYNVNDDVINLIKGSK